MTARTVSEQVREFHRAFGQPIAERPEVPAEERVRLRLRLIAEEFFELLESTTTGAISDAYIDLAKKIVKAVADHSTIEVDLVEMADALADLDYVVEGTRLEFGIDGGPVAAEVHRSNMAKLGPDGRPVQRPDGKIVKPDGWTPPDIARVLSEQGAELEAGR